MSAFLTYEGTADFVAATPYLAVSLGASGSIAAGFAVVADPTNPGWVYQPSAVPSGSLKPAGVALTTAADKTPVNVLVWGYAKSLPTLPATASLLWGQALVITGSGYWGTSGSTLVSQVAGKVVSGSAGYVYAFIDCMNNI